MPDKMDFEKWRAADIADRKATAKRVEKANRIQRQSNAAQRRVAASNNRQAQAIEAQNQIQAAHVHAQSEQNAQLQRQNELQAERNRQERQAQFAMWMQTAGGQQYADWQARAQQHINTLITTDGEFHSRVAAYRQWVSDSWTNAHEDVNRRSPLQATRDSTPVRDFADVVVDIGMAAAKYFFIVAGAVLGGSLIVWLVSRLFTSVSWAPYFWTLGALIVFPILIFIAAYIVDDILISRIVKERKQATAQHMPHVLADETFMGNVENLRWHLASLTDNEPARQPGTELAEQVFTHAQLQGQFYDAYWTRESFGAHIDELNAFMDAAPSTFPTAFPPLLTPAIEPSEAAMLMPQTREFIDELARAQTADSDEQEDADGD